MSRTVLGFIFVQFVLYGNSFAREKGNSTDIDETTTSTTHAPDTVSKEDKTLNWDVWCKYQPNSYDCDGKGAQTTRFYYDVKMDDCKASKIGKCRFNWNQFGSITACHDHCREAGLHKITANLTEKIYCRLQPDFGTCNEYYPMWYFDISIRACKGFSYSGCGGNHNRFPNAQICTAVCGGAIQY